jgi:hypothetical protein
MGRDELQTPLNSAVRRDDERFPYPAISVASETVGLVEAGRPGRTTTGLEVWGLSGWILSYVPGV